MHKTIADLLPASAVATLRRPAVRCLGQAVATLVLLDLLIWQGGGAAIIHGARWWGRFVAGHVELMTWALGLPLLAGVCYAGKVDSRLSAALPLGSVAAIAFSVLMAWGSPIANFLSAFAY